MRGSPVAGRGRSRSTAGALGRTGAPRPSHYCALATGTQPGLSQVRDKEGRVTDSPLYRAADDRYDSMEYRRTGRSGLKLPAISLGLWHNFGDDRTLDSQRAILRRAF